MKNKKKNLRILKDKIESESESERYAEKSVNRKAHILGKH